MNASERLRELKAAPRERGEARFFFHDPHFASDAVKVLPGEWFVADEPLLITTTLGSCIAVCLWDRVRRVGGLNHFLLPDGGGSDDHSGRYGSFAMELLVNAMMKRGAARGALEAKVFGGGQVIGGMSSLNVGQRNAQFALDYLRAERITVLAQDVGDIYPRKVCFLPATGRALVKRLASGHDDTLREQERAAAQAAVPAAGGSIDLF
jgi:chemotaxis protein CheD